MAINNDIILLIIMTIVLFSQGFYFGKRQMIRFMIVSLILLLSSLTSIVLNGVYTYSSAIFNMDTYQVVIAVVYIASWWILGYMLSHIVVIKDGNIGKVTLMKIK